MNELITVKNTSYARYEELLFRRDALHKEAENCQLKYTVKFGTKIQAVFEKQIDCIRKKKIIGFYQTALNKGGTVDQDALNAWIEAEMAEYKAELERMIEQNRIASEARTISEGVVLRIKRIYKDIAKKIHPDINPKTAEIPELMDLWNRAKIAYTCNDLEEIEEVEVLVAKVLEEKSLGDMEIEIPDIEDKIERLEKIIERIINSNPYLYREILSSKSATKAKFEELESDLKEYTDYEKELDAVIEELLERGVKVKWQMKL